MDGGHSHNPALAGQMSHMSLGGGTSSNGAPSLAAPSRYAPAGYPPPGDPTPASGYPAPPTSYNPFAPAAATRGGGYPPHPGAPPTGGYPLSTAAPPYGGYPPSSGYHGAAAPSYPFGGGYYPPPVHHAPQSYGGVPALRPGEVVRPAKAKGAQGWLKYYGAPSREELGFLKEWFRAVDQDGSGAIDGSELANALAASGEKYDRKTVRLMLSMFDGDGSGEIELDEFVSLFRYIGAIRESYEVADRDRNGVLDEREIMSALTKAKILSDANVAAGLIGTFDRDCRGGLKFNEYLELCMYLGNMRCVFERYARGRDVLPPLNFESLVQLYNDIQRPRTAAKPVDEEQ